MRFKRNKYIILSIFIITVIIGISYYQFYKENFSYVKEYNVIKENCYEKVNPNHEYCEVFQSDEQLNKYINDANPKKKFEQLDAITITCSIVETTIFSILQFLSPLLIIIAVVGTVHNEISSGMFKNYLMRINYKEYIKKKYSIVLKSALITPISLIIIFIIACLVTNFNFNVVDEIKGFSVYNDWKYSNFLLYGTGICVIQYLISIFYGNIGLLCCKKNKNALVTIIMGYILFLVVEIVLFVGIYSLIINKLFGFKELSEFFNITGYWFFNIGPSSMLIIFIALFLQIISTIYLYFAYSKKEEVIIENEKQTA